LPSNQKTTEFCDARIREAHEPRLNGGLTIPLGLASFKLPFETVLQRITLRALGESG